MFYIMVVIDCRVQTLHVLIVVNFVWLKNPKSIRKKLSNTTGIPFFNTYILFVKYEVYQEGQFGDQLLPRKQLDFYIQEILKKCSF